MAVASLIPPTAPLGSSSSVGTANPRIPTKQLNQDDFFQLLVTQLANQDPMDPLKDAEFMAQMAQFTSLEQTKSMGADIAEMRSQQGLLQAMGYVGKMVVVNSRELGIVSGVVDGFDIESGTPKLIIGTNTFNLGDVSAVGLPIQNQSNQNQN